MAKKCSSGLINKQLTNFIDSLSIETNNLYESKVICFERVRYFIKSLFPSTEAMLFGSNSMGLSLPSSDVDIMLYNVPCKSNQEIREMLAQIAI
jgi:DNA polymerase sigma